MESSILESRVITTDNNNVEDNFVNDYLTVNQNSLFTFKSLPLSNRTEILNILNNDTVVDLGFLSLPKLIELPENHHKPIIRRKLMINLQPGDLINVDDLFKFNESSLSVDSLSIENEHYATSPKISSIHSNCTNDPDLGKLLNFYLSIDLFERVLKRSNYGVSSKYLDGNYTCLKLTICNSFGVQTLKNSVKVINVNKSENFGQHKFFVDRENFIIRTEAGNATHYVTKAEKGDCLFQVSYYWDVKLNV